MLFISGNPSYPLVSTGMYCLISLKSFLANSSRRRFVAILRKESAPNRRRRHREKVRHYCDKGTKPNLCLPYRIELPRVVWRGAMPLKQPSLPDQLT